MEIGKPRQINFRIREDGASLARLMAAEKGQSLAEFAHDAITREVKERLDDGWAEKFPEDVSELIQRHNSSSQ